MITGLSGKALCTGLRSGKLVFLFLHGENIGAFRPFCHRSLASVYLNVHRIYVQQLSLFSGVYGLAPDGQLPDSLLGNF